MHNEDTEVGACIDILLESTLNWSTDREDSFIERVWKDIPSRASVSPGPLVPENILNFYLFSVKA